MLFPKVPGKYFICVKDTVNESFVGYTRVVATLDREGNLTFVYCYTSEMKYKNGMCIPAITRPVKLNRKNLSANIQVGLNNIDIELKSFRLLS
jgi:hypothetical protein